MAFDSLILWLIFVALCIVAITCSKRVNLRNYLLLIASYIFYALLAWQFFWLLLLSTFIAFVSGIFLEKTKYKKTTLAFSIIFFLGILGHLKYQNFFIGTADSFFPSLDWATKKLILPLGISFYFFEAIGYLIDVKRQKILASRNPLEFALFIGFFPKIVLGPIERASHFMPQLRSPLSVDWNVFVNGMRLVAWGIFKKVVVADQLGVIISHRSDFAHAPAAMLLFVAYLFAFQLYFDFSGYTDIAIGTARLFGISLLPNFRRPYASASITEFWRRWHMSLSLWFRDYLYIPLGGNRVSRVKRYRNVLIVFLLSGLWHGAGWTFVVWGCLHGLMMTIGMLAGPFRSRMKRMSGLVFFPHLDHALSVLCTFHLVTLTWIMFYSSSFSEALLIYRRLLVGGWHFIGMLTHAPLFAVNHILQDAQASLPILIFLIVVISGVECVEWLKEQERITHSFDKQSAWIRWPVYYSLLLAIIIFGRFGNYAFLYVRF